MARKPKEKAVAAATSKVTFRGFLNLKLNKQEREYVKNNVLDPSDIGDFISGAAFQGYKFSCSFTPVGDCYIGTLYGTRLGHPDAGYAMSIRHADFGIVCSALQWVLEESGKDGSLTAWYGEADDVDW